MNDIVHINAAKRGIVSAAFWRRRRSVILLVCCVFMSQSTLSKEVISIEGDIIRGNEEQPNVTHILPWSDTPLTLPSQISQMKFLKSQLLLPLDRAQVQREVNAINDLHRSKKQPPLVK